MLNIAGLKLPMIGSHLVTGNVYFVDSGATGTSDSNDGLRPDRPLATFDGAIGKCTANNGDIIVLMPGHAETTTAIAADVAGVKVIGVGHGSARPTITATTGASDLIDVTAASFYIENVVLVGAASGVTSLLALSAAADYFHMNNCEIRSGAAPLIQMAIAPGADYGIIENCLFKGTAADIDNSIKFTESLAGVDCMDWIIRFCNFNYIESAGCDLGAICVSMSSGGVTGILIQDCNFLGLADGDAAIDPNKTSSGRATGAAIRCNAHCADVTDSFVQSDFLGYVECHSFAAGDHSSSSMLSTDRVPKLTPNP